ncbi:MAG: thiamine ABC transporter substrate binding subunit [Pseudomonadales bacterium]
MKKLPHALSSLGLAAAVALSTSAFAQQKETLNVYTYDSFVSDWGPGPKIEAAFEAQCNCDLNLIAEEDGVSILNRLRVEGANTKADMVLGLDNGLIFDAAKTGLFVPHQQDMSGLDENLKWRDATFLPYDYGYFAFIYDSTKIAEPATSLKQLVESDAQVIYQDPRTSTPGQGMMFWVNAVYGDEAAGAWQQLAKHTVTVTKGWSEAYGMFLKGGADYVLSYTTSPAYHMIAESEDKYKAAAFSEGHVAQVEVGAVLKSSDKQALARSFLAFLISPEAQQILPVTNWMLPVVKGTELPEQFSQLATPAPIALSSDEMAQQRKAWIKTWRSNAAK